MDFRVGDYIYFVEGDYEYEAKVLGINADNVVTIEHADKDGKMHIRSFGGMYGNRLDVISVTQK